MRRMYSEEQVKKLAIEGLVGQDVEVKSLTSNGGAIIEGMSGYSVTKQTPANYTITYDYAGIVKNGNKITFACSMVITKIADNTGDYHPTIIEYNIPEDIGQLLVPSALGGYLTNLDAKEVLALSNAQTGIEIIVNTNKSSDTKLQVIGMLLREKLTAGTAYKLRHEVTFLLSENLAE